MTGPAWLTAGFAALMLVIAASCTVRLVISRLRGRSTETDADALHVLMGVAMAGMLEPGLSPVPGVIWRTVFAAAAAWFGWQAIGTRSRRTSPNWRCANPVPHAVECGAMIYMLLPARQAGRAPAMMMPGMTGSSAITNPALALVLILFMLGYILWAADQFASLSRARVTVAGHRPAGPRRAVAVAGGASESLLAPRFAASYKIAMSAAMGFMLITML